MATLTIRMPDTKAERLKMLAENRGISVNKLVDEMATYAIAEFDAENRFRARAARGSAQRGRALLAELDSYYGGSTPHSRTVHDAQEQEPFLSEKDDKK